MLAAKDARGNERRAPAVYASRASCAVTLYKNGQRGKSDLIRRVKCSGDPALDARGHTAVDVTIATRDGGEYFRQLDIAPGFAGNALSNEQHAERFNDCIGYAVYRLPPQQIEAFRDTVARLDDVPDARALVGCLIAPAAS